MWTRNSYEWDVYHAHVTYTKDNVIVDQREDERCKYPWRRMRKGSYFLVPIAKEMSVRALMWDRWYRHMENYRITYHGDGMMRVEKVN